VRGLTVYESTKDGDITIHPKKIFKEAEGVNPLWIHTATDYQGQIPWTYSGQGTDMEDTAENSDD
jgi:hypothetical protein